MMSERKQRGMDGEQNGDVLFLSEVLTGCNPFTGCALDEILSPTTKAFHLHFSADTNFTQELFPLMLITFGSFSLHEKIVWGVSSEVISSANSSSEQLKLKSQFTVFVF